MSILTFLGMPASVSYRLPLYTAEYNDLKRIEFTALAFSSGEYPYARNPHDKQYRRIAPGNTMGMRDPDPDGRTRHWTLEIHLVSPRGEFGGFYERLLEY